MSKVLDKRVKQFNLIKESLFPDGVITPVSEIQERIAAGTHTVRDGLIARFYAKGIAIDPGLLKRDETKDFAQAMQKSFPVNPKSPTKNVEGFSQILGVASRNNIPLDSSFAELDQASKSTDFNSNLRTTLVSPIRTDVTSVSEGKLVKPSSTVGKGKLAKGAVPPGVLKGIMDGIGDIPDPVMRDAVVASMLGLRGTDLSGIATTAELAEETFPARPYYDPQSGTLISPDPELPGQGRKGKGPDRPLGPVMKQIMDRRYAAAVDGELFPDIDTKQIAAALNKHVYTKIDKETLAVLKKKPSGYTDIRRIVASAIANQLGDPQAAAEIISHTGEAGAEKIDRVMTGFYTDVENLDSLEARRSALVGFESLMADATNSSNAKSLGQYLRLGLPEEFNAEYPKLEIKGSKVGSAVQVTEASPEQIEAGRRLDLSQTDLKTAENIEATQEAANRADDLTIKRGENATAVAEANLKLKEANVQVKAAKDAKKAAERVADHRSTIDFIKNTYKKLPGPVQKAVPFVGAIPAFYGMAGVKESIAGQMEGMGIPRSIADPVASVGAGADFLIGSIAPAAPSDVVSIAQSIPKEPSIMQAARARQAQVQPAVTPSADRVGPAAQRQPLFNEQGMVTGSENFKPVRVPDAVQNVPTSFLSNPERSRQARQAARSGEDATGFISYKP